MGKQAYAWSTVSRLPPPDLLIIDLSPLILREQGCEEARVSAGSPGPGVIGLCELPDVGAGNHSLVLWKSNNSLNFSTFSQPH